MMSEKSHCPAKNENETEQAKKNQLGEMIKLGSFLQGKLSNM